jgi:hypothetical protein
MRLRRHALCALVLYGCVAPLAGSLVQVGTAHAAVMLTKSKEKDSFRIFRYTRTARADGGRIGSIEATLASEAGTEDLRLVESDAWLHGAATLAALPTADAAIALTLYDSANAPLRSFTGTLGADGSVTLAPADAVACTSRSGCEPTGETPDVEVVAAETFATTRGIDLGVDLAGADTYEVAYAEIRSGGATAEVYWDDVGAIWDAAVTLDHEELVDVKVRTFDADGETIGVDKAALGAPWLDDGEGVNALATDEDPLTSIALHPSRSHLGATQRWHALTVLSEGWTVGDALPTHAEVALTGGETITMPANSYQRKRCNAQRCQTDDAVRALDTNPYARLVDPGSTVTITGGNVIFEALSLADLASPVCSDGICVTLIEDEDGEPELAVTAYGDDAAALPDALVLRSTVVVDELIEEVTAEEHVVFDDGITVVFAHEVSFAEDPVGFGLSGKVKLLGEANRNGNRATLANGHFSGALSRDGDGDLALAGVGRDEASPTGGAAILAGEAVFLTDREGAPVAPPAIQYANGSGTKPGSSQTSTKPQLL